MPDDDLDGVLERLFADPDALADWPPGWDDDVSPPPVEPQHEPPAYGNCEPSGWLALDLDVAAADPKGLDDPTLIEAIVGFDRVASWAAARQARLLDALAARRPTDKAPYSARWACVASEYAPDEVGVALHLSRGAACARIGMARRLLAVLPATHAVWESGRIDVLKARAIDDATVVLSDDLARAVQARVLPRAPEQTLPELKAALARAIIAVDPDGAEHRHQTARRDRRVVVTPEADGMATLWAMLTAPEAVGAFTLLTRLARGLGADDPRSIDERRADILAALLNGHLVVNPDTDPTPDTVPTGDTDQTGDADRIGDTEPTGEEPTAPTAEGDGISDHSAGEDTPSAGPAGDNVPGNGTAAAGPGGSEQPVTTRAGRPIHPITPGKPLIQVVVPHTTLTGADDQPAELAGYGPIPASLARQTAADGVWRRLITDPLSGTLLDHGRSTYHPPAGLADHVRARDVYCRFPGCRRTATDAELDHITAWSDGGETSDKNLAANCTHHHLLKTHAPGWKVQANPDGSLTWTTPAGHRHTTRPHEYGPEPPGPPGPEPATPSAPTPHNSGSDPPPF